MKNILVFIDGTGNEPDDAEQTKWFRFKEEDSNISNVLKLHLLAGGTLNNSHNKHDDQVCLYYPGVGTSGLYIEKLINAGIAISEPKEILSRALDDLSAVYQSGDQISIFGFSRGAAIARQLAATIADSVGDSSSHRFSQVPEIRFLGVWDTVASFGAPQGNQHVRSAEVLNESPLLRTNVKQAVHLVSIDDPRIVFTPTLFNKDPRVTEIWCAGVHSDVGGGYIDDGLSDCHLETMRELFLESSGETPIKLMEPNEVDLSNVASGIGFKGTSEIGFDDLQLTPKIDGKMHDQQYYEKFGKEFFGFLGDRKVRVISNNQHTEQPVWVHQSVVDRIKNMGGHYQPAALKKARFKIYDDDSEKVYETTSSL